MTTLPAQTVATLEKETASQSSTCQVSTYWIGCANPSVGVITAGCVHEHLFFSAVCNSCLIKVRAADKEGKFICHLCNQSREPHICLVHELDWERNS
jgi:hypothetical protein